MNTAFLRLPRFHQTSVNVADVGGVLVLDVDRSVLVAQPPVALSASGPNDTRATPHTGQEGAVFKIVIVARGRTFSIVTLGVGSICAGQ